MKAALVPVVVTLLIACGGNVGQTPVCRDYVRCYEATGGTKGALDFTYASSGNCWDSASKAETCTWACASAMETLRVKFPDAGC